MKDRVEEWHGGIEKPSYEQLRMWVKEAWDSIDDARLRGVLESMPQPCQDVLDADGGPTE